MNRRDFLQSVGIGTMAMMTAKELDAAVPLMKTETMPVIFVGHGSPMNAIEENEYVQGWRTLASTIPVPTAILCISAHWLTRGTHVLGLSTPPTIHDFYGFPESMYALSYAAPGAPALAEETAALLRASKAVDLANDWGFDHGTWSILMRMYPKANIPVYQLSLDTQDAPAKHYELGTLLRSLRERGVLIVGSGNIVHNLRLLRFDGKNYDWAVEFDEKMKTFIESRNDQDIINYEKLGTIAMLSVPTNDHFLPLLYTLGASDKKDPIAFYNAKTDIGSISMRSVKFG